MLSRRMLMKYSGLAWLGSLFAIADGGSEQLPTNTAANPWDARRRLIPVNGDGPYELYWKPVRKPWLPEDGQTVLLATDGGGPHIWAATFYAATETTLHGKPLHTDWCFITLENNNELLQGQLGDEYCWMPLPGSPYEDDWDHDDDRGLTEARDQKIVNEFIARKKRQSNGKSDPRGS